MSPLEAAAAGVFAGGALGGVISLAVLLWLTRDGGWPRYYMPPPPCIDPGGGTTSPKVETP